ncbi:MAG: DUF1127 domain-containing protein [Pseudomonadota bacterium]
MTTLTLTQTALKRLDSGRIPPLAGVLIVAALIVTHWTVRSRTRTTLKELPPYLLRDVGLSQEAANKEAYKPFWQR